MRRAGFEPATATDPDIVLASCENVLILRQRAGGGFDPAVIPPGVNVSGVASADLDGDGGTDIVAANAGYARSALSIADPVLDCSSRSAMPTVMASTTLS